MSSNPAATAAPAQEPTRTVPTTQTKGIVDMLLAQQMMSILQGRGTITISWQQISEIIVVMSLDEVKTALISAISTIKQMIVNNSGTIWQKCVDAAGSIVGAIKWIAYGWLVSIWAKRRQPAIPSQPAPLPSPIRTAQVSCSNSLALMQIIKNLHKMDVKSHTAIEGYTVNPKIQWDAKNLEETIITEKWSNIRFAISDKVTATINETVDIKWLLRKNGKTLVETNIMESDKSWHVLPKTKYQNYQTYISKESICQMPHWSKCVQNELSKIVAKLHCIEGFSHFDLTTYHFQSYVFAGIDKCKIVDEIYVLLILDALLLDSGALVDYVRPNVVPVRWGALFGINYNDEGVRALLSSSGNMMAIKAVSHGYLSKYYNEFSKMNKEALNQLTNHLLRARKDEHISYAPNEELNTSGFTISLQSDTLMPPEMLDEYYAYYHGLIEYSSKPTGTQQKQKIYTVICNRKKTVSQIENPAFKQWQTNISVLKDTLGGGPEPAPKDGAAVPVASVSEEVIKLIGKPPPATINKETHETVIESKEMNEIYKPFNTLYVTVEDRKCISASLQMFKDRQELLHDLGLPNKYGLLLTGPPGTGKTSTIYAVATELQKPIWYVQLSKHYTCGELRQVFEHVYKIKGGGIIVFEDIDTMTDIVLARNTSQAETAAASIMDLSSSEDTPLTLSYFLNFLDGALMQNGSIVIATTNHPERLDPAFKRPGRFDLTIELGNAKHDQIIAIYNRMMGREPRAEVLARVLEGAHSTAAVIFRVKDYMLDSSVSDEIVLEPFMRLETPEFHTM